MELIFTDSKNIVLKDPPMKNITGDINLIAEYIYKRTFNTIKIAFPNEHIDDDAIYLNPYMRMIYFIKYSKLLIKKIGINRLIELDYSKKPIVINKYMRKYYNEFVKNLREIIKYDGNIKIDPVQYDGRLMSGEIYDNILLDELTKFAQIKQIHLTVPLNMDNDHPYFKKFSQLEQFLKALPKF